MLALSYSLYLALSDFDQIWYADANFHSEDGYLTKIEIFSNSRWRTDAILKFVFWLYLGAILADQRELRNGDDESHAHRSHVTKNGNFHKFKMADGRHFENSFMSIYLCRELSDFDQIWYTYTNGRAASAEVMIQLFNSKCLPILYYGIDVCRLTNTQINSLQLVINSCYSKIFMIKSNDDIRYCQDITILQN